MNIALVADSTSDIPPTILKSNPIIMVPNTVTINGQNLLDSIEISREEFYRRLPQLPEQPIIAAASPGAYQLIYDNLISQGFEKIISIQAASLLSGINNAASSAAQNFGDKICVIDSQQKVKATSNDASLLINVTTVIGVHVGPNGLGCAAILS